MLEPSALKGGPGFRREGVGPLCRNGIQAAGRCGANAGAEAFGVNVSSAEVGADSREMLGVGDHGSVAVVRVKCITESGGDAVPIKVVKGAQGAALALHPEVRPAVAFKGAQVADAGGGAAHRVVCPGVVCHLID
jgi:hypothetical protein